MIDRLIHWLIFAVLASLTPIVADAIVRAANNKDPLSCEVLIGHGQLLLVTVAIGFPAVGAILMSGAGSSVRGIFGGLGIVGLVLTAFLYASFASAPPGNDGFAVAASVVLFTVAVFLGSVCVALARLDR